MPPKYSTKRRAYKPRSMNYARYASTQAAKAHPFVVANYNPFLKEALGARVPDANTSPSFAFHIIDSANTGVAVTGANNTNATAYYPWVKPWKNTATDAAGSVVWPADFTTAVVNSAKLTAIQAQCSFIRPVAHGIRIMSQVNPTAAQGYVHVALVPFGSETSFAAHLPATIGAMVDMPGYTRIPLATLSQKPMYITNNHIDTVAFEYKNPADDFNEASNLKAFTGATNGWMAIVVFCDQTFVTGFGTAQIVVENIVHYEALPKIGTSALTTTLGAEPSRPSILAAVANMLSLRPNIQWDSDDTYEKKRTVYATFRRALAQAGQAAITTVASRTARAAGRAAGSFAYNRISRFVPRMGKIYRI